MATRWGACGNRAPSRGWTRKGDSCILAEGAIREGDAEGAASTPAARRHGGQVHGLRGQAGSETPDDAPLVLLAAGDSFYLHVRSGQFGLPELKSGTR